MPKTATAKKPKMRRPVRYDPAIGEQVCTVIASTTLGIKAICKKFNKFPTHTTFYQWLASESELADLYVRAKETQTQLLEDEMIELADTPKVGEVVTIKPDGKEIRRGDMLEHRKLQIETRKWLMAKLKPRKYGDSLTHKGDPDNPVQVSVLDSILKGE